MPNKTMSIHLPTKSYNKVSFLFLICMVTSYTIKITSSYINSDNNNYIRRADEYIMTKASIDGIGRSSLCGDGYRIEGAVLKSYPFLKGQTYLPDEDCFMTFKARRAGYQIRIRIDVLDINDIQNAVNCVDSLRFYKSQYMITEDKLNFVECGQLTAQNNFDFVSPTGIVTAHFITDSGNVSGLGFKVILTAFRIPTTVNKCHPDDDEFLCSSGECISSSLLCDGIPHCLDRSDEIENQTCFTYPTERINVSRKTSNHYRSKDKSRQLRGLIVVIFIVTIFVVFIFFMIYFVCQRFLQIPLYSSHDKQNNYEMIVNSNINTSSQSTTVQTTSNHHDKNQKRLDDDYNLV